MATNVGSIVSCTSTATQVASATQTATVPSTTLQAPDQAPTIRRADPSIPRKPLEVLVASPNTDDHHFIDILLSLSPSLILEDLLGALRLAKHHYQLSLQRWRDVLQRWPGTSFRLRHIDYLAWQSNADLADEERAFAAAETLQDRGHALLRLCRERWFVEEQVRVLRTRMKG